MALEAQRGPREEMGEVGEMAELAELAEREGMVVQAVMQDLVAGATDQEEARVQPLRLLLQVWVEARAILELLALLDGPILLREAQEALIFSAVASVQ